jgi:hypothetical protein|tara:strand:- start:2837 stop:3505 length:669 start_codon:yes stop_codon:yes gene_type:complete
MDWKWKEESILNNYNEYTPCKDIFHAVCDEIAEYYIPKGWKYAKSRPKLTYNDKSVKIEIAFWSSGSNMPGDYVNLEILPAIYSLDLKRDLKDKGIDSKGLILGYPTIFFERLVNIPKGTKRVLTIEGEIREFKEEYEETSVLRHHNNINVYGINENDFIKIIDFIDNRIVIWKDLINDYEKLKVKISSFLKSDIRELKSSDFLSYIQFKFPDKIDDFNTIE